MSKRYVICTTARSGSNLVCDYLANTERLGKPTEFLNPDIIRHGAYGHVYLGKEPISLSVYLNWVIDTMRTSNGICGIKLLFEDFEYLGRLAPVHEFLMQAQVIRLSRRNKLSQAVSYYIAEQTGQWISTDAARKHPNEVPFDFDAIQVHLERLCRQDAFWDARLESLGIAADHWVFEDFVRDPGTYVFRLSEGLGIHAGDMQIVTHLERQSTERSEYFKAEFIARARLEIGLGGGLVTYGPMQFGG